MFWRRVILGLTVALAAILAAGVHLAFADGPLDGAWNLSPVSETFTIQQWGKSCGAEPVSGTMFAGGPVTVRADGGELIISGGPRPLRTDQCLDTMPTLSRDAHASDGTSWRTRCSTSSNDPRHAVVNAAYFLSGSDAISVAETGRYEFAISGARCIADVKRSALLRRAVVAGTVPSTTTPHPAPAGPALSPPSRATNASSRTDCSSPGDPARLEVRPSRKLLRLGDSFTFRAVVLDSAGCPTPTAIQWSVATVRFQDGDRHLASPTMDPSGKLSLPSIDFSDATFEVVATAAGHSARATVQATSPSNYESLLAQSGLDSQGERDEPSVAILATGSIGAYSARAEDGARRRRSIFIGVVVTLSLALGIVAIVGARRARRGHALQIAAQEAHSERLREHEAQKRQREEQHAAQMKAHLESVDRAERARAAMAAQRSAGPVFCPLCRREFPVGTAFCPFDSNRLVATGAQPEMPTGPTGGVSPVLAGPPVAAAGSPRGKICPTCGDRFDGPAAFCGKDGTQLVLIN